MAASARTHYEILGVAPDATPAEIAQAYRDRASEVHPDRFPHGSDAWKQANEQFKATNAAYAVLRDAEARAAYDAALKAPPLPPQAGPSNGRGGSTGIGPEYSQQLRERSERRRRQRAKAARQEALLRRGVIGTVAAVAIFGVSFTACRKIETVWYRSQAFALQERNKDTERAVRLLKTVVERSPDDGAAHYRLGLLLDRLGQTREAIGAYETAIARSVSDASVHRYLADALARAGQTGAAIDTYKHYLQVAGSVSSEQTHLAGAQDRLRALEAEAAAPTTRRERAPVGEEPRLTP